METKMSFKSLLTFYHQQLFQQVMPFWTENCIEHENGGLNNIVQDNGKILSTDKVMWSQGRALWTFSAIYNQLQKEEKWLDIAHQIAKFIMRVGQNAEDRWLFQFHADG